MRQGCRSSSAFQRIVEAPGLLVDDRVLLGPVVFAGGIPLLWIVRDFVPALGLASLLPSHEAVRHNPFHCDRD